MTAALAQERLFERFSMTPPPESSAQTWRRFPFAAWGLERLPSGRAPSPAEISVPAGGGLAAGPLDDALRRDPAAWGAFLEPRSGLDFQKLEAASLACWAGGACVRVPRGVAVESPIRIRFRHDGASFAFPRTVVIVEEGARAAIVEEHVGSGSGPSIAFSRLILGKGARASYFYHQDVCASAAHFWHQRADVEEGASLEHDSALLGSARHKSELVISLNGRRAQSHIRGALFGRGSQLFDPRTQQLHQAPDTRSELSFRCALRDRARSIYTGLIRVEAAAPGCDAFQSNNNLLLSDQARADSTPILEIFPDEVRCKHGATAGPLDPEEIFYLASRAIPRAEAVKMLVLGFFSPVLERVPSEDIRETLSSQIARAALASGDA